MILLRQFVLLLLMLIASGFGYAYPENKSTAGINLPNSTLETGNPRPAIYQQVANQATSTTSENRPSVSDGLDLWRTPWTPVIGIMLTLLLLATARLSQLHRHSRRHVARLITLIEQWPQPMLLIEGGLIVETNPAALRLLGYRDNQELLQRRPEQISPERQPDGENSIAKAKRLLDTAGQGQLQTFHWVHRHKNGHDLHVDVTLAPIDLSGRTVVLCSWFDISDTYKTQQALVESESRFRRIFEKSTSVMLLVEPASGRIISANEAATRYYGHPPGHLLTMTVADINTLPAEQVTEERQRALKEERNYFIFKHCLAGGEIRDVEVYATPIEIGGRTLLFSIVHDITERMRTSEALQKQESYQRALIDNFPFLIWLKDTESRFLAVNRPFAAAAGLADPYQLSGKTDLNIWPEELAEAYRADDALVMHSGQKKDVIEEIRHPDGNRWFETYKSPVYDHAGQLLGTVGFARDISDRMQTEEALRLEQGRAQRYLDTVQSMMVALDQEGRISMINRAGCELLGYAQEELIGRNWFATCLPQPDGLETILPEFHRLVARRPGPIDAFENQVLCRDGSQRLMSWRNAQLLDDKGNITGILSSGQDITEIQQVMEELERERGFLNTLVQTIPDLVWLKDLEGVYLACNPRFERFFGASCAQILGKTDYDFVSKEMADFFREHDRKAISKGRPSTNEEVLTFADDGHVERVETTKTPMYDAQGLLIGVLGVARDITERKRGEDELRLAANVFTHAREGITITDARGNILEVNDAFTQITGYSRAEVLGQNPRMLQSGRHGPEFYADMWRSLVENGQWSGEIWNRDKSGGVYAELLTISSVRNTAGKVQNYVALFSDITKLKEHQKQLEHIAHHDALTGLPNRVLLADRLNQAMSQAQRRGLKLAVAYLDLDGFKSVNDNHGHSIGDQLLLNLTARLKQALREGDTIARLGGDEFVAVLIDLTSAEASVPLLSRLLKDTAQPMQVGSLELQVSGSLGVTFFPQEEDIGPDQLIRQADQAMYQAKLAGKNRYHIFDPEHDRSIRGHHESLDGIRAALEERQFVLHYQPKVNMRSGEVIGVEALIRWQHPHQGLLPPSYFLPVIEDHPLAIELGEWVIETALSQHEAWKAAGLVMPVSVNVGANQLQQNDFMERLRGILAHHPELQPQSLELEVLETSALEDLDHVSQVVQACQEIGVNFALDDFGTGYSSLTYLKRLRATQLKIDRSFVSGILDDPEDLAILEGVLGLARAFRRQAIAEGVETLTHGVMLLQLGCELAQGYAIARAMPAEELPHWIETWRPDPSWRDQQAFNHDDLGLLFACVEHRAWVSAIEHALELQNPPPPLDHNKCRFSLWLASEGRLRHGGQPALNQVETLHRQVHELAAELLAMQADGQGVEAKARLHELYQLRDSMLELLTDLAETIHH